MTAEYLVPDELDGHRLDRAVAVLAGVSRAVARTLVESGAVALDGEPRSASHRVHTGQVMHASLPEPEPSVVPEHVPFDVAYESTAVRVIDKPAGVVVHPGAGNQAGTLAAGLLERFDDTMDEEHRWGIVHRLDRDTSGLMLVARHEVAFTALQAALKRRTIGRVYLALVGGRLDAATGTIEAPVGRDPRHPTRMAVTRTGRPARTHYSVMAEWDGATLVEVRLDTGRTHQIRVHFASIGSALVGDPTYGRGPLAGDPGRVWLHAVRLAFTDPDAGADVEVQSPLPRDLADSLAALGPPVHGAVPAVE